MENKHFWESKTFWFNALLVVIGIAEILNAVDLGFLPPHAVQVIGGVVNIILRIKTRFGIKPIV